MMDKVWIVGFDGCVGGTGYGNIGYLLGIYDSKYKASAVAEGLKREHEELKGQVFIYQITLNNTFEVTKCGDEFTTDVYLGGWVE